MTREEFDLWIDYHSQEVFPGVDTWLRAMTPSKLLRCLRGWWGRLKHIEIEHAQRASMALLEGGTDPPFGQHAIQVVTLAKKHAPAKPDLLTGTPLSEATQEQRDVAKAVVRDIMTQLKSNKGQTKTPEVTS